MRTLSDRYLASLLLVVVLAAASTAAELPQDECMDLKVSLRYTVVSAGCSGYPPVCWWLVTITADVTWTRPLYSIGNNYYWYSDWYWFYMDGYRLVNKWGNWGKTSERVLFQYLNSQEECEAIGLNFVNSVHTYRLDALPNRSGWPTITDFFDYLPPDIMTIDNYVGTWPEGLTGRCELSHRQGAATEGFDNMDTVAPGTYTMPTARIASVLAPESDNPQPLVVDARPKESTSDIYLQLSLVSSSGDPILLPYPKHNELRFNIPTAQWCNVFGSGPIVIQQYDPLDPDAQFPVYDVRKVISRNGGTLRLGDLCGSYPSGQPYACLRMSFSAARPLGDLNGDGRHDLRDFSILGNQWRHTGAASSADLAGPKAVGLPDGVVNYSDLQALCQMTVGIVREGFEGGKLESPTWVLSGFPQWKVTKTHSYSGAYAAQAGKISHNGTTSVWITVTCHAGEIAFWRKVSSERFCDGLEFCIDGQRQDRWSGELGWERVSFPVSAGKRTFKWTYVKDASSSAGSDTAWIDDITFPALSLD